MLQYNAGVGDTIQIGELDFTIAGILTQAQGAQSFYHRCSAGIHSFPVPGKPVYFKKAAGLNTLLFKYASATQLDRQLNAVKETLDKTGWDCDTAESEKANQPSI